MLHRQAFAFYNIIKVSGGGYILEADVYVMSAKVRAEVKDAFGLYDPDNPSDVTPTLGASNGKILHDLRGKAINDPAWDALLDQLAFASKQAIREIYLKPFEICVMNYDIAATSLWLSCPSLESLCICLALSTVAHGSIGRAHTRTRPHCRCCTSWGKSRGARAVCGCIGQTGKAA